VVIMVVVIYLLVVCCGGVGGGTRDFVRYQVYVVRYLVSRPVGSVRSRRHTCSATFSPGGGQGLSPDLSVCVSRLPCVYARRVRRPRLPREPCGCSAACRARVASRFGDFAIRSRIGRLSAISKSACVSRQRWDHTISIRYRWLGPRTLKDGRRCVDRRAAIHALRRARGASRCHVGVTRTRDEAVVPRCAEGCASLLCVCGFLAHTNHRRTPHTTPHSLICWCVGGAAEAR
jgi:hypothetical protein